MDFDSNFIIELVLGVLAAFLAAECIILFVKYLNYKSKMEAKFASFKKEEAVKTQKRLDDIEITLRERSLILKTEYDELMTSARKLNQEAENKANKISEQLKEYENAKKNCEQERLRWQSKSDLCDEASKKYSDKLAELTNLDKSKIEELAKESLVKDAKKTLSFYADNFFKTSEEEIKSKAKKYLLDAMQTIASQESIDSTTCLVKIPNDAMKGRLIGKDGRNIRSFENETGTNLIIDETPDSVMISCFNPVRREIAALALEKLLNDGRVNPSTIEERVAEANEEIEKVALEKGLEALRIFNITDASPEIAENLGKLYFHLSLNQNTLTHSIECARLATMIASELNLNSQMAARAALFHDIGKALDSDSSHAIAGAKLLEHCKEASEIVNAAESHHDETKPTSLISAIVQIADSMSSSRPGARMEASDAYFKRAKLLEDIAHSFDGISDAYVIQAGREIRVILSPDVISESLFMETAAKIKDRISEAFNEVGAVKVTVIREQRWSETSKSI